MKKIIVASGLLVILFSCSNKEKEYVENYPSGVLKLKGSITDNLLQGRITRYSEKGKITAIQNYVNGKLEGIEKAYIDSTTMLLISEYKNGELIKQKFYDTITQRVQSTLENHIAKIYSEPNKLVIISNSEDTTHRKFLKFTEDGKIRAYQGPLDFLTKKDSSDLTNAYPNWKEMINEWEHNQLKDKHEK